MGGTPDNSVSSTVEDSLQGSAETTEDVSEQTFSARRPSLLERCLEIRQEQNKTSKTIDDFDERDSPENIPEVELKNPNKVHKKLIRTLDKHIRPYIKQRTKRKLDAYESLSLGFTNLAEYAQFLRHSEENTYQQTRNQIETEVFERIANDATLYESKRQNILASVFSEPTEHARTYLGINSYRDRRQFEHLFLSKPKGELKTIYQFYQNMQSTLAHSRNETSEDVSFLARIQQRFQHTKRDLKHRLKHKLSRTFDAVTADEVYMLSEQAFSSLETIISYISPFNDDELSTSIQNDLKKVLKDDVTGITPRYHRHQKKKRRNAVYATAAAVFAGILHLSVPHINTPQYFTQTALSEMRLSSFTSVASSQQDADSSDMAFHTIPNIYWKTIDNKQSIDAFLEETFVIEEHTKKYSPSEQELLNQVARYEPEFLTQDDKLYETAYYNPAVPTENTLDLVNFISERDGTGITVKDSTGEIIYHIPNMHTSVQDIPDTFHDILTVIEDQQFFLHPGINPYRSALAVHSYLSSDEDGFHTNGNSSITQQLAKLLFFWDEEESSARTDVRRKMQEMEVAFQLEMGDSFLWLNKEDIIDTYLNHVYGGGTPYGIEARGLGSIFNINYGLETDEISERYAKESIASASLEEQGLRYREIAHFIAALKAPTRYIVNFREYAESLDDLTQTEIFESRSDILESITTQSFEERIADTNVSEETITTLTGASYREDYHRTLERISLILETAREEGIITDDIYSAAQKAKLSFTIPGIKNEYPSYFDTFCEELRSIAPDKETYDLLLNSNITYHTNLDPTIQSRLQERIDETTAQRGNELTGGGIIIQLKDDADTPMDFSDDTIRNAIVAVVGNNSERYIYNENTKAYNEGYSQITDAKRSIGSIAKLAILTEAYQQNISPTSAYWDVPRLYEIRHPHSDDTYDTELYMPHNYRNSFSETPVTLQYALNHSMNSIFLKLASALGTQDITDTMNELMILDEEERLDPVLSNALGSQSINALDLMNMITTIANQGVTQQPRTIDAIETSDTLYSVPNETERTIESDIAYQLLYSTSQTVSNGTLYYNGYQEGDDGRYFGKTGTSQNFADAQATMWTYNYAGYIRYNRPDSNESIPYRRTRDGSIMTDWHGDPIRMTGSQEPTRDVKTIFEHIEETKDIYNPTIQELKPETIEFKQFRGMTCTFSSKHPQYHFIEQLSDRPTITIKPETDAQLQEYVLETVQYPE